LTLKKQTIRIKDIAEKANVSTGTVDRVLHNRGRVAEEVRQKVLRIVDELSYEPNLIARTLGSNRTYRLAALVPDANSDEYWQAPESGINQATRELNKFGISVSKYIFNQFDAASFIQKAQELTQHQPDGILIAPLFYRESLQFFSLWHEMRIPFVLFNTQIAEFEPLSYIGQDSYQSGLLAGKLINYGQSEKDKTFIVAHIEEDIHNSAHLLKKEQGFRDYFAQSENIMGDYQIIRADLHTSESNLEKQIDQLFEKFPNIKGFFVTTSKAHVIAAYLQQRQLTQIRLVGYDLLKSNLHYLHKGYIDFLINQNPKGQGYHGILGLADYLVFKKQVSAIKYLPLDIVTKENVQYYHHAD
jgi:LacI family transcriptional regulator